MSVEQALAAMAATAARPPLPLAERRARFEATASPPPMGVRVTGGAMGGVPGLWVEPEAGAAGGWTVLWLHGGGFMLGSARSFLDLGGRIALAAGARVWLADYRLAPEDPFPAGLEDARAALAAMLAGHDPARLCLGGDSAGGNLALAAAQGAVQHGAVGPGALWLVSPYLDLTHTGASVRKRGHRDGFVRPEGMPMMAANYLGGASAGDVRASPLFGPMAGLPPVLVQVGSEESLRDDAWRCAVAIEAAGGSAMFQEWAGMLHDFPCFAGAVDEGGWAIAQGAAFLQTLDHARSGPFAAPA